MAQNGYGSEEARFAALTQRVTGLESSLNNLASSVQSVITKLDERGKTPWPILISIASFMLLFVGSVGGLAYAPVWSAINRIETTNSQSQTVISTAIAKLADTTVGQGSFNEFKATYENNRLVSRAENIDKFGQASTRIDKLSDTQVPRAELERVWQNYDQRFTDQQRQIDTLSQEASQTYNARDIILDLRSRLDRVERTIPPSPAS